MPRFIIDTDTASDDAVALVMALRHPDVVVDAITVVAGNVPLDQAVQNALYTVELTGSDVPVYAGSGRPLLRELETAQWVHGEDGMGDCGLELTGRAPAPGRGPDVLVDGILGAPGEITLVALGPLTNVAVAVTRAPEIVDAVERVVVMGGTGLDGPGNVSAMAEYNFWADPEAAAVVMRSGLATELVGWDVSIASAVVTPARAAAIRALDTPLAHFTLDIQATIAALIEDFPQIDGPDLPDPIAMAHAIDPAPASTVFLPVDVIPGDGPARGVMEVDRLGFAGKTPNATIVTDYPEDDFFTMLHDLLI